MKSIFGRADEIILHEERGHVDLIDFKFGRSPVEDAETNPQSMAYGIGVIDMYDWAETLTVHFIIPRRDELLIHTFTRAELENLRERIRLIIERASVEKPALNPNTEGCRFCGNRVTCTALADKMLPIAKKYADSVEDFGIVLMDNLNPAEVSDPAVMGKMKAVASVVEKWASAVNDRAVKMADEEGAVIPGFSLNYRAPAMKIDNPEDAYIALSDLLTPEQFMAACKASLPSLAKAYASKLDRGEKKKARPKVELLLTQAGVLPEDEDVTRTPYLRKTSEKNT